MSIDKTSVAIHSAEQIVNAVNNICAGLDQLEQINEQLSQQNPELDLASYEAAINANTTTSHCSVSTFKNLLTEFSPALVAAMKAYAGGTPTQNMWAAFMQARRW
jgi:hypothetical protein